MLDESIRVWAEKIFKFTNELKEMIVYSEHDVSRIGKNLQTLLDSSKKIGENASEITELIASKKTEEQSLSLREILKEIENTANKLTGEIGVGSKKIDELLLIIDNNYKPLELFKKIVKQLITLSITTKIENSRFYHENNGFFLLAEEVEKLSEVISLKCSNILNIIKKLQQELQNAKRIFSESQTFERGIANDIISNILVSFSSITDHQRLSIQTADKIKNNLGKITEEIGKIIISLQFHDITRQQIEHVVDALCIETNDMRTFLNTNGKDDVEKISKLSKFIDVCGLQTLQLINSREEFVDAISMTISNLQNISTTTNKIIEDIQVLIGFSGNKERSYLKVIEGELNSVINSLEKEIETNRKLIEEIEKIFSMVGNLLAFVDEIEDISIEIELTALNARIKAARVGQEGAALGILSEAIQNLSDITKKNTKKIISTLFEFNNEISNLRIDAEEIVKGGGDSIIFIRDKITEQIILFNEMEKYISNSIKRLEDDSKGLVKNIEVLVRETTVHEKVNKLLTNIVEEITQIINKAKEYSPNDKDVNNLKDLHLLYTMEKEREIHKRYKSNLKDVEKETHITQESLGDNVELF